MKHKCLYACGPVDVFLSSVKGNELEKTFQSIKLKSVPACLIVFILIQCRDIILTTPTRVLRWEWVIESSSSRANITQMAENQIEGFFS